jgi:hypothetical protein
MATIQTTQLEENEEEEDNDDDGASLRTIIQNHNRICHTHTFKRIIEAVELVTPHMLINTWQELEYRLDICRATTDAHIEVYGCG